MPAIFLGSFRLPYEEIRDIVLQVDEERLSESLIQVRLMRTVAWYVFWLFARMRSSLFPVGAGRKEAAEKSGQCAHEVSGFESQCLAAVPATPHSPSCACRCCCFLLSFGCSQSRPPHIDRRDPPIRLGTMGDEGRGFAKSGQLHPPFFRLLSKTIIDELPQGSLFCLPIYVLFFSVRAFLLCFIFVLTDWRSYECERGDTCDGSLRRRTT